MTAYLFTWNQREGYSNIQKLASKFKSKGYVDESWRILSHQMVRVGDSAYLLKQGKGERGIFGIGKIIDKPFVGNDSKYYVPIRFFRFVDPKTEMLATHEALEQILEKKQIDVFASGMPLPKDFNSELIDQLCDAGIEMGIDPEFLEAPETMKPTLVNSRIGQGKYRQELLKLWDSSCAITGCAIDEVLIASHIKKWSESSNQERLDKFNGLLLSASIDRLFDRGLISFSDDGFLLCKPQVTIKALSQLGISKKSKLNFLHKKTQLYLAFHRKYFGF